MYLARTFALANRTLYSRLRSASVRRNEGGVGVVVYFRKEGRALGEVTKYLGLQPSQAWWRLSRQVFPRDRVDCGREGYALPGSHARRIALAGR
jgi:hypothetical protein